MISIQWSQPVIRVAELIRLTHPDADLLFTGITIGKFGLGFIVSRRNCQSGNVVYRPNSISVDPQRAVDGGKEMSQKIQELWDKYAK